jgi:filamentous hemagglutinin
MWAAWYNETGNPFYFLMGCFASLWTPETYIQTAVTLATAPIAAAQIAAAGLRSTVAAARVAVRQVAEEIIGVPIPTRAKGFAGLMPSEEAARYQRYWEDIAKPGSLSNRSAREWYLSKEADIPRLVDSSLPLEQQAKQAFGMRNALRTTSRNLMEDRKRATWLEKNEPNMKWEQVVSLHSSRGHTGDDLWRAIITSSQKSRASVNADLGL